jgi:large subunit ribosomal protein L23
MSANITLKPRLFEKSYALSQQRVYVFDVDKSVNKHTVARAVEAQFEVKVTAVNIANIPGKTKRTISIMGKRMSNSTGTRSDYKKAYVTLAEGHSLPFFEAAEAADEKQEALQAKVDKAAAKKAEKTHKADKPARKLGLGRAKKAEDSQAAKQIGKDK